MKTIYTPILIILILLHTACYSFSGSSLNPEIKTCNIATFPNYSTLQNASLSQDFTLDLQDRFDQRTKLELVNNIADINIEGEITDYRITAENTTAQDLNAQNKLTIKVAVRYDNKIEPEKSFDKTFSDFENFDANTPQPSEDVIEKVNSRIIDQIFNAIVSDW